MNASDPQLFCLKAARPIGEWVAATLGIPLSEHEERDFEDGEHKSRPLESVRGRDVFVIESLYRDAESSVNDKLVRLLFFLGALRDAGAHRVTAVIPSPPTNCHSCRWNVIESERRSSGRNYSKLIGDFPETIRPTGFSHSTGCIARACVRSSPFASPPPQPPACEFSSGRGEGAISRCPSEVLL